MEEEEEGVRARSFRRERYSKRRVFLRSYPLQWDGDTEDEDEMARGMLLGGEKGKLVSKVVESMKHRVVAAVLRCGEAKVLLLRRLKSRVEFYLVACQPFGFKPSTSKLLAA